MNNRKTVIYVISPIFLNYMYLEKYLIGDINDVHVEASFLVEQGIRELSETYVFFFFKTIFKFYIIFATPV